MRRREERFLGELLSPLGWSTQDKSRYSHFMNKTLDPFECVECLLDIAEIKPSVCRKLIH